MYMKRVKGYPLPLGISERGEYVNFSVVVSQGERCILKLYKKGEAEAIEELELLENDSVGEVRFVALLKEDVKNLEYMYEIDGALAVDPYAKSVSEYETETRAKVYMETYDWDGDNVLRIPEEENVAYSMHVRGFTKDSSSPAVEKGTFRAVIEMIPYLKELGINQIQCMPVYAFQENYWGYGEAYWFAVKDLYAAVDSAETELKDMIKACHKAGIEVVLHMPFEGNLSKQIMFECLRYYVVEYHVDGFVLNPYVIGIEEAAADPVLKGTKLLVCRDDFQNTMRQFLKGDEGQIEHVMWWLRQKGATNHSYNYVTKHQGFTLHDLVSYNEKHNVANGELNQDGVDQNFSWNCGEEGPTKQKAIQELREKQIRNAFFLVLFANGTPCILAGDEFYNSQAGNNNVYCQDNAVAWLNWKQDEEGKKLQEYVKQLITLRKKSIFLYRDLVNKDNLPVISYHGKEAWRAPSGVESRSLGVYYHDEKGELQDVYVAYNMLWYKQDFALPELQGGKKWRLVMTTEDGIFEERMEAEMRVATVPGRTIAVFIGK